MLVRTISGLLLMVLMALFLAACGDEAEDAEPTAPPAVTDTTETETETETAADDTGDLVAVASPSPVTDMAESSPVASPVGGVDDATPIAAVDDATPIAAVDEATPVGAMDMATPAAAVTGATPAATPAVATPEASPEGAAVVPPAATSQEAAEEPVETFTLNGEVALAGQENVDYVLSDEGCVGLGANGDLRDGRQVLVRDETGTIVGVSTLATSDADGCVWEFSLEVPESEFYEVAIPMKTVMVFSHDEVEANNGEVSLQLP